MAASLCTAFVHPCRWATVGAKVLEQYPCLVEPSRYGKTAIETVRLRLRRLRPSDEADLVALDSDPDVMRYVGSPPGVKPPAETR
jgi:RimJ/RimL family protein N-acetyltransferase